MNVDRVLDTMNRHGVGYLLIGGMNFLLRHRPVLTFDVDLWIEDSDENRRRTERALAELEAAWGQTEEDWGPVAVRKSGWLDQQGLFSLSTPHGAVDIFRSVKGLDDWHACHKQAVPSTTPNGVSCLGLSDHDMLRCQYALIEGERNVERIRLLELAVQRGRGNA